jgi:cellulose synthase/poly-beta-1,6-N-acetylglucosamine synthase-like glycosyltransferase
MMRPLEIPEFLHFVQLMPVIAALACFIFFCYFVTSLALLAGTHFGFISPQRSLSIQNVQVQPFISILIAARNEEKYLPTCLDSLLQSDYASDRFEIIVIDDGSTDGTLRLMELYAQRYSQVRALSVPEGPPGISGKANALAHGAAHARGDFFLFTDADCLLPPSWMRGMIAHFLPATGLVGGFTLLHPPKWAQRFLTQYRDTLFAKLQSLDWLYLLMVGAGAAGLGKPVSIIGNNFGVRREAYEQVGGHARLGFSIVEDFALMRKIARTAGWQVHFPMEQKTAIFSYPAQNWGEFWEQRRRWAAGGREFGGFAKYLMLLALCCHLAIFFTAFTSLKLFAMGLLGMLLMELCLLARGAAALRCQDLLKHFLPFRLGFLVYNLFLAPIFAFPTSVRWKGRSYRWDMRRRLRAIEE